MKFYGHFKRLDEFIRSTGLTKDDMRVEVLPELPSKLYSNGSKKTAFEITQDLQVYMRNLLAIPRVARMLAVKNFFILNEIDQEFVEEIKSSKKLSDSMDFDFSSN